MQLTRLLPALGTLDVTQLVGDSRQVRAGALFFALSGEHTDGNLHAGAAVRAGAVAVVSEAAAQPLGVPWIVVPDVRATLAAVCRVFFDRAGSMRYAGVTGTNGKTTITYLFEAIAKAAGETIGLLGTVEQRVGEKHWPATHTTLESIALCERLQEMENLGAGWAVLEVSSHALAQKRADALRFSVSAFTNLTPDHLDFHLSMEDYFLAKQRLFNALTDGTSVIHVGGAYGQRMYDSVRGPRLSVGRQGKDIAVTAAVLDRDGTHLELQTPLGALRMRSHLIGEFNVENLVVAVGMGVAAGFSADAIVRGIESLAGVPGRLQMVRSGTRTAFVDYAHTPDALTRVLQTLRALPHERLLCVFGCGGDRDQKKRPLMGEAAAQNADVAVVTSDNPRSESPQAIIDAIVAGMHAMRAADDASRGSFIVLKDRRAAIRWAVAHAEAKDVLLVAGKGHEDYQIVGSEKRHFDDREELLAAFAGAA